MPKTNPFRKSQVESITSKDSESENEPPQFSHYEPNILRMMENMGYDLTSGLGLNFGKGRRTLLRSFVPKGKAPDYYHRTRRGWAMCQLQSYQPLSLKSHYIMTTHQARHCGSQMSVSATSSKTFRWTWFQQATGRWRWGNDPVRYRSLDQLLKHSLGYSLWTTWTTHRG